MAGEANGATLQEAVLNTTHDRAGFSSGVTALDDFLKKYALQQIKRSVTVVRVLVDVEAPQTVLGYYSLSAAQVSVEQLREVHAKRLPKYPVPCFRMGRLAVDARAQGKGYGAVLLGLAVQRCLAAREHVAAVALLVDAKDNAARAFYELHGFTALRDHPLTLYLGLGGALA